MPTGNQQKTRILLLGHEFYLTVKCLFLLYITCTTQINPSENPPLNPATELPKLIFLLTTTKNEITYTLKSKFYHSKSFHEFPSGWHTVHKEDLINEDVNLFIFNIEFEKQFHTFLFSRQELLSFVNGKTTDQNDLYHFYFHKKDKIIEVRDQEKDALPFYNHWSLPTEIIY